MYTKHTSDQLTRWRISNAPHDSRDWEEEKTFDWTQPPASIDQNTATYSNIFYLPAENRTYDFVRSVNKDPSCLISSDEGSTWSFGGKLITDENLGYVDAYTKYASNGKDRIDFIATEHHPRDFNNSIYHGYLKDGRICRSDGTVLKENIFAASRKSPRANELTMVLAADTEINGDKITHCWNTDLAVDADGNPYCLLTCRANDVPEDTNFNDHRFFYARFDGSKWNTHQLAKGGAWLWNSEQDYIGGGSVDPQNPTIVYISTPIDPRDDKKTPKHEIFKGVTADGGRNVEMDADHAELDARQSAPDRAAVEIGPHGLALAPRQHAPQPGLRHAGGRDHRKVELRFRQCTSNSRPVNDRRRRPPFDVKLRVSGGVPTRLSVDLPRDCLAMPPALR